MKNDLYTYLVQIPVVKSSFLLLLSTMRSEVRVVCRTDPQEPVGLHYLTKGPLSSSLNAASWSTVTPPITALESKSKTHLVWCSLVKYLIGYSYLEHSDMMVKSSEALWLASEVNMDNCDWKLGYLHGLCGVFGLMYRQVGSEQWKNNCSIYKGPFNRRGSSVSLTGTQTACPPATMNSLHHKIRSGLWTTCFLLFTCCHIKQRCLKSFLNVLRPTLSSL